MNEPQPTLRLLLAVYFGPGGRWTAEVQLPDGSQQRFNSPFELARFVAQKPLQPPPSDHGLR